MTQKQFEKNLQEMLRDIVIPYIRDRATRLSKCGAIDLSKYDASNFAPVKLCLIVALEHALDSTRPLTDEMRSELENLRRF